MRTQLPYALTSAAVSAAGFLLAGILGYNFGSGAALIAAPVSFVLLAAVLLVIRSRYGSVEAEQRTGGADR